jgi:hypothetical protein
VAGELSELVEVLHRTLGEITDIDINWSTTEGALDLNTILTGASILRGAQHRRPRVMVVAGRDGCAKLLVVPHMTSQTLGAMVMRRAAAMPAFRTELESQLSETADRVVRAAQVESAKWTARTHDARPIEAVAATHIMPATTI